MIDFQKINQQVEDGYIKVQHHPTAPLRIFNYSVKAQFEWKWTPEIMACRGLIVDDQDNIVCRPFEKFFSYEQLDGKVPDEPFEVFEKLDGSLGILYLIHGEGFIATRGSFVGEQAIRGSAIFKKKYSHLEFNPRHTYLFEIIYPENRIVVNYKGDEDLYFLAAIDTATGKDVPVYTDSIPTAKRYDGITDFSKLLEMEEENKEGFVVLFKSGTRVKLKFEEYKRLHKILTGINERSIWDMLRSCGDFNELLELVPDEFHEWVKKTRLNLELKYAEIEDRAVFQYKELPTRKETAMYFQKCDNPGILFSMLDVKDYSGHIWKLIKPRGDTFFREDIDTKG